MLQIKREGDLPSSSDFDQIASRLSDKVIFDGRNIYKPHLMESLGFTYYSVGRPPIQHGKGAAAPVA